MRGYFKIGEGGGGGGIKILKFFLNDFFHFQIENFNGSVCYMKTFGLLLT